MDPIIAIASGILFGYLALWSWRSHGLMYIYGDFYRPDKVEYQAGKVKYQDSKVERHPNGKVEHSQPQKRSRMRRLKLRKNLIRANKKERESLIEAIKEHTSSIETLDATLTCLNELLKNKVKTYSINPLIKNSDGVSFESTESVESCNISRGCAVTVGVEPPPVAIYEEIDSNYPRDNFFCPKFSGSNTEDKSADMHIYDSDFKPPKCTENTWMINTMPNCNETPKSEARSASNYDELLGMFADCKKGDDHTSKSVIKSGLLLTKPGGGYARIGDLSSAKKEVFRSPSPKKTNVHNVHNVHNVTKTNAPNVSNVTSDTLSRGDELDIINSFGELKGENYFGAAYLASVRGYAIHPVYVNNNPKNPAPVYSRYVLGVKVKDSNYTGSYPMGDFSTGSVIVAVTDVGGQDIYNRGL